MNRPDLYSVVWVLTRLADDNIKKDVLEIGANQQEEPQLW